MSTIIDLFVPRKRAFHDAISEADPIEIPKIAQETLLRLCNDYLDKERRSEGLTKLLFGLLAGAIQNSSVLLDLSGQSWKNRYAEQTSAEDHAASSRMAGVIGEQPDALWRITLAMAVMLLPAIALGLDALGILLAIGVALIAYLASSGRRAELNKIWPLNFIMKRMASRGTVSRSMDAEQEQDEREHRVCSYIDGFEDLLRRMDTALEMIYKIAPAPSRETPIPVNETILHFMQDLAQATIHRDGAFALQLAQTRLGAVASSLNLNLCDHSPETETYFMVDTVPNGEGETPGIQTIKPAVMCDGECLAYGYAKRVV